ncbi:T9SS type A sorting domain-containing protein [bacterium SCSIO 12741]|nr:T9SS type A sorting domain-containing protein [bacterium SCSIO 12741]
MKSYFALILLCFWGGSLHAQGWGESGSCNVNVHDPGYSNNTLLRSRVVNATVKWAGCTGTLINRNTSDGSVGYYILTAEHCIDGKNMNLEYDIYFNYQSPDASNNSTEPSNRGVTSGQSTNFSQNSRHYHHRSKLRVVGDYKWGDLALLEIVTPVPPHFNFTYAGWLSSRFYNGPFTSTPGVGYPTRYVGVHHPEGDIKKISGVNNILWLENPVATHCYTITRVIDVLFGWIWQRRTVTTVICRYVDNPWMVVPNFSYGVVEPGSSGSGMFNTFNREIGVLSGGASQCGFPLLESYGKLYSNYGNRDIRSALNPNYDPWVDLLGLPDRKVTCYHSLNLPGGAPGSTGYYFPAKDYGPNNKVLLRAQTNINTTEDIIIFEDADYEFVAGNGITLGKGFHAKNQSNFRASIAPCTPQMKSTPEQRAMDKLDQIELPESKQFDITQYLSDEELENYQKAESIQVYPNPNNGRFQLRLPDNGVGEYQMEITSLEGKKVIQRTLDGSESHHEVNLESFESGVYILRVHNSEMIWTERIIKE